MNIYKGWLSPDSWPLYYLLKDIYLARFMPTHFFLTKSPIL